MPFQTALLAMVGLLVARAAHSRARNTTAVLAAVGLAIGLSVSAAETLCNDPNSAQVRAGECALDKLMERQLTSALSVVEAARWRCPILDAYAEQRFKSFVRDKRIAVDDRWRSEILALGCGHPRITGAAGEVRAHIDDVLFIHLDAALSVYDRGRQDIIEKSREPLLAALRTEHLRLKARIEVRSGDGTLRGLRDEADRIVADILYRDDILSRQLHWRVKAEIIRWTAPLVRREPNYQRLHWSRLWQGYRPREPLPEDMQGPGDGDKLAVSSAPVRLSEDNYPPGAAYAWTADAIHVVAHVNRAGELLVDIGWQPYRQRELEPLGLALSMGEWTGQAQVAHSGPYRRFEARRERAPLQPHSSEVLSERDLNEAFPRRNISQVRRFVFGADALDALHTAHDDGAIILDMTFRDEDGIVVSANDILKIDGPRCGAYCQPVIPLRGFGDTLHWAMSRD